MSIALHQTLLLLQHIQILIIAPGEERVYFGATADGNADEFKTPVNKGVNESSMLMFGKMCSGGSCPGSGSS